MAREKIYTEADCIATGREISLKNRVIVFRPGVLKKDLNYQLGFCLGGAGADANPEQNGMFIVELKDGESIWGNREDAIGLLKPELLSEEEKLQLSQISPLGALSLLENTPIYSCYSFLEDGRYAAGVELCTEEEIFEYVEMQSPYQHRVMVCDSDDFCVLEVVEGKQVYPILEEPEEQEESGMSDGMKIT